ncbi:T5orf172 domain-containing protein [Paracoccus pantotrophus]|nr:T5orf172 domain-containing protein [Paracoccus pantotrophus]
MSKGYVYILKNPSMPGLLKIGKTTRSVQQRCDELWQTGVPTPFEVVAEYYSPDCHELERNVHQSLADKRVSEMREFFAVEESKADNALGAALYEQVSLMVEDFLPDCTVLDSEIVVDGGELSVLAIKCGVYVKEVADSIGFLTPDEMMAAVNRWREFRRTRGITMDYPEAISE